MNIQKPRDPQGSYFIANRISNIDFLRGIAAISVLIWHYQHFYFGSSLTADIANQRYIQPLYSFLHFFYTHGHAAVQFFWILSGFVFFHVYREKKDVTGKEFFAHRFARLYPLHFLTLCLVAILQFINIKALGSFQIYPFNDLKHFILNVFFASHWGFQDGFSFNAPIWSVSVEVVVYLIFLVILKFFRINWMTSVAWIGASYVATRFSNSPIFVCSLLFALGGTVNLISKEVALRGFSTIATVITLGAIGILALGFANGWITLGTKIFYIIFAILILLATTLEDAGYSLGRIGDELGNITYSSYMIHVPIQLAAIIFMDLFLKNREVISTPEFLIIYLITVLFLSVFVFRKIEYPLKKRLLKIMG